MGKHDHASCEHDVSWCRHCDVIYCQSCDMQWYRRPSPTTIIPWGGTQYAMQASPNQCDTVDTSAAIEAYAAHNHG
jgi:hypothetical protein